MYKNEMEDIEYISTSYLPSQSANSVHVMNMCEAISDSGRNVTLHAAKGKNASGANVYEKYGVENIFEINYSKKPSVKILGTLVYALMCTWKVAFKKGVLVYSRHAYAALFSLMTNNKIIFEAHKPPKNLFQRKAEKIILLSNNTESFVVISSNLKNEYKKIYGGEGSNKIKVAHDAAKTPNVNYLSKKANRNKKKTSTIGYVGSLSKGKGLKLIGELSKKLPEQEFHIVGGKGREIEHWRQYVEKDNVTFHGYVNHQKVGEYYKEMEIGIYPIQKELRAGQKIFRWTSPLKIFEYMSYGIPVVCSRTPSISEVINDGENGFLVDPRNTKEWVYRLKKLANNHNMRYKMSKKAIEIHRSKYTWKSRVKKLL
jgi:glycosyltransferase involved in cell wall biosynthesis